MEDELDMENQLEMELAAEQEELLEVEEEDEEKEAESIKEQEEKKQKSDDESRQDGFFGARPGLSKVRSLPANFTYNPPVERDRFTEGKQKTRQNCLYKEDPFMKCLKLTISNEI